MGGQDPSQGGVYLYAIVSQPGKVAGLEGLEDEPVEEITHGSLTAVISNVSSRKVRPLRRNMGAHHRILKAILEKQTPLPMAFGIIAGDKDEVLELLKRHEDAFQEHLSRLEGRVEMGLRVTWDVPNIFEYMVASHPELRDIRDSLFKSRQEPSQEEMIEMGRLFEHILTEKRSEYSSLVEEILSPSCDEIRHRPERSEKEVMHLVCLVRREDQGLFEDKIFEAANRFDNDYAFDFNGPWAPHNFVDLQVEL